MDNSEKYERDREDGAVREDLYATAGEDESEDQMNEGNKSCLNNHTSGNTGLMVGEIAQITEGIGIPMWSQYSYRFRKGGKVVLTLTPRGVEFQSDSDPDEMGVFAVCAIWILSWYGIANDLGRFSPQMTESEAHQAIDFVKRLENPEYAHLPIDVLVQRVKAEIFLFWSGFIPGEATKVVQ